MTTFVGQLMSKPVYTVERSEMAVDAARQFLRKDVNCMLVTDERGKFYGIVTTGDLLRLIVEDQSPARTRIDDYVTQDVVTVRTDTDVREAADIIVEHGIHHLPVVGPNNQIKGLLSTTDVTKFLANTGA